MNDKGEIRIMNDVIEFLKNYIWKNGFDKIFIVSLRDRLRPTWILT